MNQPKPEPTNAGQPNVQQPKPVEQQKQHEAHKVSHHKQNDSQPRRVSMLGKFVVGVVVFVAIAWVLSALRTKAPENSLVTETDNASSTEAVYSSFAPVTAAGTTYSLGGVSFLFEPQSAEDAGVPSTRVRLKLNDVKRNGSAFDVASYRLGTYRGECSAVSADAYLSSSAEKGALAFAACNYQGSGRQLAVFQEGQKIVVKARTITEDGVQIEAMTPILYIDLNNIPTLPAATQ